MGKSHGGTTPRSKEERPAELAMERYYKDKSSFISALISSLKAIHDEDTAKKVAPHLVHMIRDPDIEIVLSACRALNALMNDSYGAIFDAESVLGTLCTCFLLLTNQDISDPSLQQVIVEVSSGIISFWSMIEPDCLERSVDHLMTCRRPCLACLQSNTVDVQVCALHILSAMYDPRIRGSVSYDKVSQTFEHVILLITAENSMLLPAALNVCTRAMESLPSSKIDEILTLSYEYIKKMSMDEEIILSAMNFVESSIVHRPVSTLIDADMCGVLCEYVEQGIDDQKSTSILALQILARLVNEDQKFSLVLEKYDSVLEKITGCVEDIESSQLLPSLFIIGHVSKSSPSSCEFFINHESNIAQSVAAVLVHCEQAHVQQVAAWVLGVLGSSTASSARNIAESGALLAMIDVFSRSSDDVGDVGRTCLDSCTATVENLDFLDALEALLKLHKLPDEIMAAVFHRISILLSERRILCADFVQSGSLETLIAFGENQPELQHVTKAVCDLYPPDLVNRCSPKYMKGLIEKFKRESIRDMTGKLHEEEEEEEETPRMDNVVTVPDTADDQKPDT